MLWTDSYFGMVMGRPTKPLNVTPEEKAKLTLLARRPKSAQAIAMRARIVLACAEGSNNATTAKKLHITGATVCKWRERFRVSRLEGLLDEPRPGAPRSIRDAQVEESSLKRWGPCRSTARTGARGSWPKRLDSRKRPSYGSGVLSDYSRIEPNTSSSPKTRNSSRRYETLSGCT